MTAPEPRKANIALALGWFAAAVVLLLADALVNFHPTAPRGADTYYVVVHRSWTLAIPSAFALFGALYLGMTSAFPVRLKPALGWVHLGVMAVGAALTKAPQFVLMWGGLPGHRLDPDETFETLSRVATAGAVLMGLSLLIFFWALIDGLRRRAPG